MQRLEIRRLRLTVRHATTAIAVCAACLWSPKLLMFGAILVFWWIFITGVIYSRSVRRVAGSVALAIIVLVLCALCLPAAVSNCRRGRAVLPNQSLQRTPLRGAADLQR